MDLREIAATLDKGSPECDCGNSLVGAQIYSYDHDGGLAVDGFVEKQWVYLHCSKCGYDWAIWKLLNKMLRKWTRGAENYALVELRDRT